MTDAEHDAAVTAARAAWRCAADLSRQLGDAVRCGDVSETTLDRLSAAMEVDARLFAALEAAHEARIDAIVAPTFRAAGGAL